MTSIPKITGKYSMYNIPSECLRSVCAKHMTIDILSMAMKRYLL